MPHASLSADVVIFGGGCAGLWLLDELRRRKVRVVLLEAGELGKGQTAAAQGILHGGLKYQLHGGASASAAQVRDMPAIWRACLAGEAEPNLSQVALRDSACCLWRTDSLRSKAGMLGAQLGLKVRPQRLEDDQRPSPLANCPGRVYRLEEQVIDTVSLVRALAERNRPHILQIYANAVQFQRADDGSISSILLNDATTQRSLTLHAGKIIFAAGAGNAGLRAQAGLSADTMQRRPLHMVMLRGDLPWLNGHCVDGAKTRVTITSDRDSAGRVVWQLGGQIAEDGVRIPPAELIAHAQRELAAVLPGWPRPATDWATYRVDRAERKMPGGARPDDVQIVEEQNILTVWPTKLVLAPRLAQWIIERIVGGDEFAALACDALLGDSTVKPPRIESERGEMGGGKFGDASYKPFVESLHALNWPAPAVAQPPWECVPTWHSEAMPMRKSA